MSVVDRLLRNSHGSSREMIPVYYDFEILEETTAPVDYDIEKTSTIVYRERDAPVATALGPMPLVQHFNSGVFPLAYGTSPDARTLAMMLWE